MVLARHSIAAVRQKRRFLHHDDTAGDREPYESPGTGSRTACAINRAELPDGNLLCTLCRCGDVALGL